MAPSKTLLLCITKNGKVRVVDGYELVKNNVSMLVFRGKFAANDEIVKAEIYDKETRKNLSSYDINLKPNCAKVIIDAISGRWKCYSFPRSVLVSAFIITWKK